MGEAVGIHHLSAHDEKLRGLTQQLVQGKIPHAILLIGTPTEAGEFANTLSSFILCQSIDRPCRVCVSCRALLAGSHPDYYQMQNRDASSIKTGEIGDLQAWLSVRPHYGERKVYVIEGIENATQIAANRLLKTLEEPTAAVFAILTTSHASLVLPTIRSRCSQYVLNGIGESAWEDASTSEFFTKNAQGDEVSVFAAFFPQVVQWTETWIVEKQPSLVLAEAWVKLSEGISQSDALLILSTWLRDLMHVCIGDTVQLHFTEYLPQMNRIAPYLRAAQWGETISLVIQTRLRMKAHVALVLNIEQMCIRLWEVMRHV